VVENYLFFIKSSPYLATMWLKIAEFNVANML
jgi:hypothetical protein